MRGVGSISGPEVYVLGFPWPSLKERQSRDGTCGRILVLLCRGQLCGVGSSLSVFLWAMGIPVEAVSSLFCWLEVSPEAREMRRGQMARSVWPWVGSYFCDCVLGCSAGRKHASCSRGSQSRGWGGAVGAVGTVGAVGAASLPPQKVVSGICD